MTGSAREEAERLVAALLAMASQKDSRGLGDLLRSFSGTGSQQHRSTTGWATGTAECCVCPVCRAIAAVREPTPYTAERLATGAGDLATGVASMLRAFSTIAGVTSPKPQPRPAARPQPTPDQAWTAATDHAPVAEPPVDENAVPWGAATRSPAPEPERHEAAAEPDSVQEQVAANPAEPVSALPVDEAADPWGAATRSPAPKSSARPTTRGLEPKSSARPATRGPVPKSSARPATPGPAGEETAAGAAEPGSARHEAAARPAGGAPLDAASMMSKDAGPAVVRAEPRTEESDVVKPTRGRKTDIGDATPRNRPADPWAAAVADDANRVSRGKTGVAGTGSVDHDVAAHETPAPAEDRGTRAGDDAPGDAV